MQLPDGMGAARRQVVQALIKLGIVVPTSDLLPIRRSINYFLDNFERQTKEQETIGVRRRSSCALQTRHGFRHPGSYSTRMSALGASVRSCESLMAQSRIWSW